MMGIIFSIIAGAAMSFQGVINTRLGEKIGLYEANAYIQGTAFILAIIAMLLLGKGNIREILSADKIYLTGGILGLIITITVMLGIKDLSPLISISIILISQLTVAAVIDAFGLLGTEKVAIGFTKIIGFVLMVAGVVLFKIKT